jgi:hypothetical protein
MFSALMCIYVLLISFYYFWEVMKSLLYAVNSITVPKLMNCIRDGSMHIRNDLELLLHFRRGPQCADNQGGHFKQLLH